MHLTIRLESFVYRHAVGVANIVAFVGCYRDVEKLLEHDP